MQHPDSILVMGLGNYLMADEGIGVHAVQRLAAGPLPAGVDTLDGGTGGFHLLEYFERYDTVILVDATLNGEPPGTIRLIRPHFASDFPRGMSTHDIGLKDLVCALQLLGKMPDIYLYTVGIANLQHQGVELTPKAEEAVPLLLFHIEKLIARIQVRIPI